MELAEVKGKLLVLLEKVGSWVSFQERPGGGGQGGTPSTLVLEEGRLCELTGLLHVGHQLVCMVSICASWTRPGPRDA